MIIYNVTVNVDNDIREEWLQWMRETHIPDVMQRGIFSESRMVRVLADEDSGGTTYAIQYTCANMEAYENYRDNHSPGLQKITRDKYGDKIVAFRTLLETLD